MQNDMSLCMTCTLTVAAMEAEAMPLINILDLKEDIPQRIPPPAPAVSYSGSKHGMNVHVVRNGEPSTVTANT